MADPSIGIDEQLLARFVPMSALSGSHLRELSHHAQIVALAPGDILGDTLGRVDAIHYLLDGAITLSGGGQPEELLRASDPASRFSLPAAENVNRRARATEPTRLLRVDRAKVSTLLIWAEASVPKSGARDAERLQRDITALLLQSPLFARIPPSNIERIGELIEPIALRAGDIVIRQGEAGDYYFVIESGRCEVLRETGDGSPAVRLAELGAGDSFGEEALLTDSKRNATVRMCSDGTVLRLTREYFIELISAPLIREVSHERAEDLVATGARWLDVRLDEEFSRDGLENAIHIPLGSLRSRADELPAGGSFVTYCNSGRRAQAAAFLLSQRGIHTCCLRDGIARRRPVKRGRKSARDTLPALHAELMRVDAELEQALERQAAAEAAREVEVRRQESDDAPSDTDTRLAALTEQAERAATALRAAMGSKRELERRIRDAQAQAATRRRAAEVKVEQMRTRARARLEEEKQRLAARYRDANERLQRIEEGRRAAEARFAEERQRIEQELEEARARMEAEAARIRASIESARDEAETKAASIRDEHASEEQRLRRETEDALREERRRLEEEFSLSIDIQERARQELDQAEAARIEAEQATAAQRATAQAELAQRREQERAAREREVQRLREQRATAQAALERAQLAREAAKQRQEDFSATLWEATRTGDTAREDEARGELETITEALALADDALNEARQAHASATQAESIAEQTAEAARSRADELRLQLYEEMEAWISEEEEHSREELERAEHFAREFERVQREKDAKRAADEQATAGLLSDIQGMLSGTDVVNPLDNPMRTHMVAEEKARLVQRARRTVAEQAERARAALGGGEDGKPDG